MKKVAHSGDEEAVTLEAENQKKESCLCNLNVKIDKLLFLVVLQSLNISNENIFRFTLVNIKVFH